MHFLRKAGRLTPCMREDARLLVEGEESSVLAVTTTEHDERGKNVSMIIVTGPRNISVNRFTFHAVHFCKQAYRLIEPRLR